MAMKPEPQFLRIQWEDIPDKGPPLTLEAMACLRHRREIALAYASARGLGELGERCDLCDGGHPRPFGSELSHSRRSQLGPPDGKPCKARPFLAPAEQ
jgi:hypothetical protein